jgi:hypothetical protein
VASVNILAAKFYMDAVSTAKKGLDPHFVDAPLLAAIVKYGCVFKADSTGKSIDPRRIFTEKTYLVNRNISDQIIQIDGPSLLPNHERFIRLRDKFIAHDDRIIGHTETFSMLDQSFNCEHVLVLTQMAPVFSAVKQDLPLCRCA